MLSNHESVSDAPPFTFFTSCPQFCAAICPRPLEQSAEKLGALEVGLRRRKGALDLGERRRALDGGQRAPARHRLHALWTQRRCDGGGRARATGAQIVQLLPLDLAKQAEPREPLHLPLGRGVRQRRRRLGRRGVGDEEGSAGLARRGEAQAQPPRGAGRTVGAPVASSASTTLNRWLGTATPLPMHRAGSAKTGPVTTHSRAYAPRLAMDASSPSSSAHSAPLQLHSCGTTFELSPKVDRRLAADPRWLAGGARCPRDQPLSR